MMNRTDTRCFVAVLLLGLLPGMACATPFFTQDPRTLPAGKWRVETHILASHFDHSLVDGHEVPLLGGESASATTFQTRVRYGAADKLTLFLDVPSVRKALATAGGRRLNTGVGDLSLLAKYRFHDDRARGTRAAVALSTKLDTGEYRRLPPELALGTGQTNSILVVLGEKQRGLDTYYASAAYIDTGERSDVDTDPGQVVRANLAVEHKLGASPYQAVAELNWFHQGKFEEAGATVDASGSTTLDLAVGLQYSPKLPTGRLLILESELQLPVCRDGYVRALPDYTYYLGAWTVF